MRSMSQPKRLLRRSFRYRIFEGLQEFLELFRTERRHGVDILYLYVMLRYHDKLLTISSVQLEPNDTMT